MGRFTTLSRPLMTEKKISWDRFEDFYTGVIYGTLSRRVSTINDDVASLFSTKKKLLLALVADDRSAICHFVNPNRSLGKLERLSA